MNGSLVNKLCVIDFTDLLVKHDIIVLSECWFNKASCIDLKGFKYIAKCRKRKKKARRDSGGLIVYIKENIWDGIKEINFEFEDGILITLCKSFFKLNNDIHIYAVYLKPINSSRRSTDTNIDPFEIVIDKIAELYEYEDIILLGDLNSRTGNLNDICFENDPEVNTNNILSQILPIVPVDNNVTKEDLLNANLSLNRTHMDTKTNDYGHRLIRLVKMTNLVILNGRSENDLSGNFTFCSKKGNSPVDYIIVLYCMVVMMRNLVIILVGQLGHRACCRYLWTLGGRASEF